jgi:thiol:disulfide interchange protein DsbD
VRKLGLIYTLGVLSSFLILALIIIVLRAGWGAQFGSPYFLIAMSILVMLIALNLFGVFEVMLGSGTLSAASTLASKQGAAGAFFNGLLATVLSTSCSAPFLGAAVGFASSLKNPGVTILIMLTVGLGLSAPYLVLSWNPAWLRFVPKPGPWMNRFKVAMGFPMVAATVWLCSLVRTHYGDRAWWLAMFLIFVAVAAWIFGEFVQRGGKHRPVAFLAAVILLISGYLYTLEHGMRWREPTTDAVAEKGPSTVSPRGVVWSAWSPEAVAAARQAGRPVVVDFTATWCPTCNTIVKPSFEKEAVQKKLKDINAVALVADYSRRPKAITDELERFERSGVPLVLVYPKNQDVAPMVFDLVTPGTLLEALDKAAK